MSRRDSVLAAESTVKTLYCEFTATLVMEHFLRSSNGLLLRLMYARSLAGVVTFVCPSTVWPFADRAVASFAHNAFPSRPGANLPG